LIDRFITSWSSDLIMLKILKNRLATNVLIGTGVLEKLMKANITKITLLSFTLLISIFLVMIFSPMFMLIVLIWPLQDLIIEMYNIPKKAKDNEKKENNIQLNNINQMKIVD